MIEYLDENFNLHVVDGENECAPESWLLVPKGATFATGKNGTIFRKDGFYYCDDEQNLPHWRSTDVTIENVGRRSSLDLVWQRKDDSVVDADFFEDEKKSSKTVSETLVERQSQYGCFEDVAFATENIIGVLKRCGYENMPNPHKMAMYMIVSKMARLVNGDCNHLDSWHDIGGYSKLIENLIGGENE